MIKRIKPSNYAGYNSQKKILQDVKKAKRIRTINILGMDISVFPKVYGTGLDSELIAKTAKIGRKQHLLT